jgi:hypothetical protein
MSFGRAQTINPIVKSKSQHELSEQWVGTGRVASPRRPVLRSGHKSEAINANGLLGDRPLPPPHRSTALPEQCQQWNKLKFLAQIPNP